MTDIDHRIIALEETVSVLGGNMKTVIVLLEGEPVLDIKGVKIDTKGGLVRQGKQHTEALDGVDHKLDGILDVQEQIQEQLLRPGWSRSQRIAASMVIVVALGSISTVVWVL